MAFGSKYFCVITLAPFAALAQAPYLHDVLLKNWSAPAYWQPAEVQDAKEISVMRDHTLNPQVSLPTQPLVFVAMSPCRIIDTRVNAGFPSPFGPPNLIFEAKRTFPVQSSTRCSIPSAALAYSFNVTVTPITTPGINPPGYLGYLTLYPTGGALPNASTMNNYLGTVVSNAAIVPAGENGSIDAYALEATDLIIDINGYYVVLPTSGSQWTTNGQNIFYNIGSVGVGTSTPSQKLDVAGVGRFTGGIMFGDGTTQTTAAPIGSTGGSQWTTNGSTIYFNAGNVGIGTTNPGAKLEVNGSLMVNSNIVLGGTIYAAGSGVPVFQTSPGLPGNLGIGYGALQTVTPGPYYGLDNTGIGWVALQANTTGSYNVAVGARTLVYNTTGIDNTAVGSFALLNNTIASENTAIGVSALQNNSGNDNTGVGLAALQNSLGSFNTALGNLALGSTSGSNNIGIGYTAGMQSINGSNNIFIGNQGISSDNAIIRIGAQGTHVSTVIAGISGANVSGVPVVVSSSGQLGVAASSRRFKQNIEDMGDATSNLMKLRPVVYRYKQPFEDGSQPRQFGLIAEEVENVYPELVAHSADGRIETVKYQMLDSMLLNEVQKQYATIKAQRERIESLEERLSRLEALLEKATAPKQ